MTKQVVRNLPLDVGFRVKTVLVLIQPDHRPNVFNNRKPKRANAVEKGSMWASMVAGGRVSDSKTLHDKPYNP